MIINALLEKEKMSRYRLSKESGVAMTTITDICSGKADLDKCTAGTLHKIARVLNVTVDSILENNSADNVEYRCSFETFKSNTCHHVKDMGDIDFIIETLEKDEVRKLYERRWCREAMYLLAMIDYLSRIMMYLFAQIIMISVPGSLKNYIFLQALKWHMQRRETNV